LVPETGDDAPGSAPAPGEQDLGGADAGDDRLQEEVPPQDQQLHGASIGGILPQLGVLAAYAAVLLTLAAWRLRRVLSG
jgi:hypothetical protein